MSVSRLKRGGVSTIPVDDLHGSASKHEGGADHDREAQLLGLVQRTGLVCAHATGRLLDVQLGQDLVPLVPVLSIVYALGLGAPDLHIALACHQQPADQDITTSKQQTPSGRALL